MEKIFVLVCVFFLRIIISSHAISSCNGPCNTLNDCDGQLICIKGKCNDDPGVGTPICKGGGSSPSSPPPSGNCPLSGERSCKAPSFPAKYKCSPPVTSTTKAKLTLSNFSEGGEGEEHRQSVMRGTMPKLREWLRYQQGGMMGPGSRCGRMIKITASNGRSDSEHGFLLHRVRVILLMDQTLCGKLWDWIRIWVLCLLRGPWHS